MRKPGESGNNMGLRHAVKCQKLVEDYNLDEEMAMLASRQGKYKRAPFRDQISAYELLRDNAYGKPAVVQVANLNEVCTLPVGPTGYMSFIFNKFRLRYTG
jgi:hypothetical protein